MARWRFFLFGALRFGAALSFEESYGAAMCGLFLQSHSAVGCHAV